MVTMARKRSLYECSQARVMNSMIYCAAGHSLNAPIGMRQLVRGEPLQLRACQDCPDFEGIGEPVPAKDRGWYRSRR